jgi:hypothetical protein
MGRKMGTIEGTVDLIVRVVPHIFLRAWLLVLRTRLRCRAFVSQQKHIERAELRSGQTTILVMRHVRFAAESGHRSDIDLCPLSAIRVICPDSRTAAI